MAYKDRCQCTDGQVRCGQGARGDCSGCCGRDHPHGMRPSAQMYEVFSIVRDLGAVAQVHAENGDIVEEVRDEGAGRGAPGRQRRALHPQTRGGWRASASVGGGVASGASGEPGGLLSSQTTHDHHFSKVPQPECHCGGSPAPPAPADCGPVGTGPLSAFWPQHTTGSVACPSATACTALGNAKPMAFPSALGLRGGVPVPPPFLLVPSGPPLPDTHSPEPAGHWGLRSCGLWGGHTQRVPP